MKRRIRAIAAAVVFCGILQAVALAQSIAPSASGSKCRPAVPKTGEVLIAGGYDGSDYTAAAEIFDPMTESFASACNMTAPRVYPQVLVVTKPTDRILVLGGESKPKKGQHYDPILKTTDSLNPLTGKFTKGPNMPEGVEFGIAVELDDGKSLVTVGQTKIKKGPEAGNEVGSNLAMIYDPVKNKFTMLGNTMISNRTFAAAALINGCSCANQGKVLIAGGFDIGSVGSPFASAELFDPATNSFAATGHMNVARMNETATSLSDGTILITGGTDEHGSSLNSAEIYDPSTETFAFAATPMNRYRAFHTATRLEDGTVLIAGGLTGGNSASSESSAEIYNPVSGIFVLTAQQMNNPRYLHSATLLSGTGALNGWVLISGGYDYQNGVFEATLDTAELFNPTGQTFTLTTGNMLLPHAAHAAALLP